MADTQRAKAAKLVDADVLGLGAQTQRTRKTTNPVEQANMSRQGAASPQPGLTPTARVFAKGGSTAGKKKKAMQVAGMLSALTQAPMGGPAPAGMGAAPPAAGPMGGAMGAPGGMKRGGKMYAKGGKVHSDEAEDKVLIRREIKSAEKAEKEPGMKRGGKCMKCGGKAHGGACKMATGGHMVPRHMAGRKGFAMGGPGKMRKGEMTPAGLPTKPKREPGNLI
jgi:hypothetical protein